jgi:hypothetical protein
MNFPKICVIGKFKRLILFLSLFLITINGLFAQTEFPAGNFWAIDGGAGVTGILIDGLHIQGVLDPKFWLSPSFMAGCKLGASYNAEHAGWSNIFTLEILGYFRWNFLHFGTNEEKKINVFLQGGLGAVAVYRGDHISGSGSGGHQIYMADKMSSGSILNTRGFFMGDLAVGVTVPILPRWHVEAQIRGGYPHIFGASITTGYKFKLPQRAAAPAQTIQEMPATTTVQHQQDAPPQQAAQSQPNITINLQQPAPAPQQPQQTVQPQVQQPVPQQQPQIVDQYAQQPQQQYAPQQPQQTVQPQVPVPAQEQTQYTQQQPQQQPQQQYAQQPQYAPQQQYVQPPPQQYAPQQQYAQQPQYAPPPQYYAPQPQYYQQPPPQYYAPQPQYIQPPPQYYTQQPPPQYYTPPPPEYVQPPPQQQPQQQARPTWTDPPADSNVRIIPGLPDPSNGRVYKLQVGSYKSINHAHDAFRTVRADGFNAAMELYNDAQYGQVHRVCVLGIPSANVFNIAQQLGALGFRVIWVRD